MSAKILHVAKNIPTPYKHENDIILKTIALYRDRYSRLADVVYPVEYVPAVKLFEALGPRYVEKVRLGRTWRSGEDLDIDVLRYPRLPHRSVANMLCGYAQFLPCNIEVLKKYHCATYDVVHCHHVLPDFLIYEALKVRAKKRIITVRQGDVDKITILRKSSFEYLLYKRCIDRADEIVAPSFSIAAFIRSEFDRNVVVIPHGCTVPKELQLSKDDGVVKVVTSARMLECKNIDWVIRAVNDYAESAKVKLYISGDGPLRQQLEAIAGSAVTFLGALSFEENMRLFAKCDIFALPSLGETFGRVYIEALSYGLTCIGLQNTGLDGYDLEGTVIWPKDYLTFKAALFRLIDNPEIVKTNRSRSREVAMKMFDWPNVLDLYHQLYNS